MNIIFSPVANSKYPKLKSVQQQRKNRVMSISKYEHRRVSTSKFTLNYTQKLGDLEGRGG
jgi:hypothetical protein